MRISDWSSDVCSSDLLLQDDGIGHPVTAGGIAEHGGDALGPVWRRPVHGDEVREVVRDDLVVGVDDEAVARVADGRQLLEGHEADPVELAAPDRKSTRLNSSH